MSDSRRDQLRRVTAIYDRLAPTWDARTGLVERWLMGTALRKRLGSELVGDVLEVGTGSGASIPYVNLDDARLRSFTGSDISLGMLREIDRAHPKLRFLRMSADLLPFRDATFDVVTCSLVLCTVPDVDRALREMSRVCKPDGKLVILEHVLSRNSLLAALQKRLAPLQLRQLECHLDRTTDRDLRQLGFPVVSEHRRFFGIFVLSVISPIGAGD